MVRKSRAKLGALFLRKRPREGLAGNTVEEVLRQLKPCGSVYLDDFIVRVEFIGTTLPMGSISQRPTWLDP